MNIENDVKLDFSDVLIKPKRSTIGGPRSTGTYIGAKHIKDFGKCTTFIRVNKIHDRNV